MASITEMIELQQHQRGQINQGGGAGIVGVLSGMLKQQEDEKRRVENAKNTMSEAQQKMQMMAQMTDNSATAKATGTLDDDVAKRRKGVISVSDFVPEQSMSVDEEGAFNLKFGTRRATPQEQKAQFEMQKSQIDMEKAQAKSDLLNAYVQGKVQEGAILGEMATLGITADEFDMAAQARERMRQIAPAQPMSGNAMQIPDNAAMSMVRGGVGDVNGTPIPMAQPQLVQPQEQPFRFKQPSMSDKKAQMDMESDAETKAKQGEVVRNAAQDTLSTIAEIKKGVNNFGALGGLPSTPWDYSRKNWEANTNKLLATRIVNLITEMKTASKTGATGFGQLSDKERVLLENASTALNRGLSPDQATKYLDDMENMANKILGGQGQRGQTQGGQPVSGMNQTSKGTQYRVISE